MRRGLLLVLAATTGLTLWSLLTSPDARRNLANTAATSNQQAAPMVSARVELPPTRWEAPLLEPAIRNPFRTRGFANAVAPGTPVVEATAEAQAPIPTPSLRLVPPPEPTPFSYRFVGRVLDPQGRQVNYLSRGTAHQDLQPIQVGTVLADGYMVEAVSETSIQILHSTTHQRHVVSIPDAATPETQVSPPARSGPASAP